VERIERGIDQNKFQLMQSALETLKHCRDTQAHTYIKGTTPRLDSPSVTMQRFSEVYDGLKNLEQTLRRHKL
jgi:hypothetical protein